MASSVFLWFNGITGGGNINTGDGTAAADAYGYSANAGLGQYRIGTNNEGFSAGAALIFDYNTTRVLFAQPIAIGAAPAGTGAIRLTNNQAIVSANNSAQDSNIIWLDASNNLAFGQSNSLTATYYISASGNFTDNGNHVLTLGSTSNLNFGTRLTLSGTAPTIASGFGTSPSIAASNGTMAFVITIGSSPGSTGVLTFPAATTGWVVTAGDLTTPGVNVTKQTAGSNTSVTLTNYNSTLGTAANWTAGDSLICTAMAY